MCSSGSHVLYLGEKREKSELPCPPLDSQRPRLLHQGPLSQALTTTELSLVTQARSGASLGLQHDQNSPRSDHWSCHL